MPSLHVCPASSRLHVPGMPERCSACAPPFLCRLDLSSRFAIVGPNGIGKSTLLGLISGELQPTKGHVYRNPKVRGGEAG